MRRRSTGALLAALLVAMMMTGRAASQPGSEPGSRVTGHSFQPERRDVTPALVRELKVPPEFKVDVFAEGIGGARMMVVGADGTIYVTRPGHDDVVALRGPAGRVARPATVVSGLGGAHGIAIHQGRLYVAGVHKVIAAELRPDGTVGQWQTLIADLPGGGQHGRRTIGFGPDGRLYVSIGSTCNACVERDPEHATILAARADGSERRVFARGLRNTIGFGWHPETRELWGMDHGVDWRGDDQPPEELNRLVEGADYGWPYCIGVRRPDPFMGDPAGTTKAAYCARTQPPALTYQAHSAPIGLVFYTGRQFPAEYRGDAFAAMHGSWNRRPATGYKVVRIRFENGRPVRFEDFLTGFLVDGGRAQFGRPAGVAVAGDGALLVSDDANGVIYRVAYPGAARRRRGSRSPRRSIAMPAAVV